MKACLLAHGRRLGIDDQYLSVPAEFLPIAGRPLIQRYIEALADAGATELLIILRDEAERFTTFLGSGERWGVSLRYETLPASADPYTTAAELTARYGLDHAFDPVMPGATVKEGICLPGCGFAGTGDLLTYLHSVKETLNGVIEGFVPSGREASPGVRVSHHAKIHRRATLLPPVFIGPEVDIGAGAIIGPHAAIEQGSFIGRDCRIERSVVMPMTILGEDLEIRDAIVDGPAIFRPSAQAVYIATDRNLADSLKRTAR
jgi:NDP-sugar pyrophosphorylase family protein